MVATTNDGLSSVPPAAIYRATPKNPRLSLGKRSFSSVKKSLLKPNVDVAVHRVLTPDEKFALRRQRPDISKFTSEKWPLLHVLASCGESLGMDRLLKMGVDINALDKDGYTALQRAVLAKRETIVNLLLRRRADPHVCDSGGATLLHYSVQTGSLNFVRWFLDCGIDVNSCDKHGWTPLHLAVVTGRADIVRLLLVRGADKNKVNKDGLTPLDICLSLGRMFNAKEVATALKTLPQRKTEEMDIY